MRQPTPIGQSFTSRLILNRHIRGNLTLPAGPLLHMCRTRSGQPVLIGCWQGVQSGLMKWRQNMQMALNQMQKKLKMHEMTRGMTSKAACFSYTNPWDHAGGGANLKEEVQSRTSGAWRTKQERRSFLLVKFNYLFLFQSYNANFLRMTASNFHYNQEKQNIKQQIMKQRGGKKQKPQRQKLLCW